MSCIKSAHFEKISRNHKGIVAFFHAHVRSAVRSSVRLLESGYRQVNKHSFSFKLKDKTLYF